MDSMSKNKRGTPISNVAWESMLYPIVSSSIHPFPGNWLAIGREVMYHFCAAHAFSAGIKRLQSTGKLNYSLVALDMGESKLLSCIFWPFRFCGHYYDTVHYITWLIFSKDN